MQKVRRRRRSAAEKLDLLARHADSGLSAAAFCERERICIQSFYRWRAEAVGPPVAAQAVCISSADGFQDLGMLQPERAGFTLRLDLGGGLQLQLVRN